MLTSVASHSRRIAVLGLGYVGLPVVVAFGRSNAPTIGFDIDTKRVADLIAGIDYTAEVASHHLHHPSIRYTSDPDLLAEADFYIVTVPTPVDEAKRPDLRALMSASQLIGRYLKSRDIVVYESTVYPGATEEECVPVLEAASGLVAGRDFAVGYSPERINPGDREHTFERVTKVVSAQTPETLEIIAAVYGTVVSAGVYRAPTIRIAEAAKVIENTQRDLNIALMNELSLIFNHLGIDTLDVLDAASTKWNFVKFTPGLVGGHCVGVDPFYLTYVAEKAGLHPEVILAGRRTNDNVGARVARETLRRVMRLGSVNPSICVLGVTFKENMPDLRNSKAVDIVRELRAFGISPKVHDPFASSTQAEQIYGITLSASDELKQSDGIVLAVPHRDYVEAGWPFVTSLLRGGRGVVSDVKGCLDRSSVPPGVNLWRL